MKIKNQITKNLGTKTQPDSVFQLSVTTIEKGILESFSRLPQAEREIIRKLLEKFGSQRDAAIRFPVAFGPKSINERRRFGSRDETFRGPRLERGNSERHQQVLDDRTDNMAYNNLVP